MKKLRQYRIPTDSIEGIDLSIYQNQSLFNEDNSSIKLVNISGGGLAFISDKLLSGDIEIFLNIRKKRYDLNAKIIRTVTNYQRKDLFFLGVEFVGASEEFTDEIIKSLLQSLTTKTLRALLIDMIQNESDVAWNVTKFENENEDLKLNNAIIVDILRLFYRDIQSRNVLDSFAKEMCHQLDVDYFSLYYFENNFNDLVIYDLKDKKNNQTLFPVTGAMAKVRDTKRPIVGKINDQNKDGFFNLLYALLDKDVSEFLLVPVFDTIGKLIGVMEFSNSFQKKNSFDEDAIYQAHIFSTIMGAILFRTAVEESHGHLKKLEEKIQKNLLIGSSEKNQYLNSTILESGKVDSNILISGEFGVGKTLVATSIHKNSERSEYGLGYFNCHEVFTISDIDYFLDTSNEHTGMLELYSGGTIIFKDINALSSELGEHLFKKIHARNDIRFIATSVDSLEVLSHFTESYRPLIHFLSTDEIRVPPLRDRREDIAILSSYFMAKFCEENGLVLKKLSQTVMKEFSEYDWPGNVGELRKAIERMMILEKEQSSIEYKKSRVVPILDRDLDYDFMLGIDLKLDMIGNAGENLHEKFNELFFYFYVEDLIEKHHKERSEIHKEFGMTREDFDVTYYHSKILFDQMFGKNDFNGNSSDSLKKAA